MNTQSKRPPKIPKQQPEIVKTAAPEQAGGGLKYNGKPMRQGLLAAICAILLIPGVADIVTSGFRRAAPSLVSYDTSDGQLSYEAAEPVWEDGILYQTYHITKGDPQSKVDGSLSVDFEADHGSWDSYYSSSLDMGFECDEIWITAYSADLDLDDELSGLDIDADLTSYYSSSIEEYRYLLDDEDDWDYETIFKEYKYYHPEEFPEITVNTKDAAQENGIVTFTLQFTDSEMLSSSLYGSVNIVYKKDGQVVFADVYDYSGNLNGVSKTFAYTPPITVPEYDDVEVISMHS